MQSKYWVFTLNNPTHSEIDNIKNLVQNAQCSYLCYGKETGEQQTEHLQGYMEFEKRKRLTGCKRVIQRAHWESRRGTQQQAIDYCAKDGDFFELGTKSVNNQGKRTDLEDVVKAIEKGDSIKQIALDNPTTYIKYHRGIAALQAHYQDVRSWKPDVIVMFGRPGTGKTRYVFDRHNPESVYCVPTPRAGSEVWFDGYCGQEIILLDDFYGWIKWSFLLKLLDRYQHQLPVKGGFVQNVARKIYITSNQSPAHWYKYDEKMVKAALLRRIDEIWKFKESGQFIVPKQSFLN